MRSGDWPPYLLSMPRQRRSWPAWSSTGRATPRRQRLTRGRARAFCERLVQEWGGLTESRRAPDWFQDSRACPRRAFPATPGSLSRRH